MIDHEPSPRVYRWAGYVGVLGCVAAVVGDATTVALRDGVTMVENSISRVAAGEHAIIADTGLSLFALGILGVAFSLFRWDLGGRLYRTGTLLLAVCALLVFLLAVWNDYDRKSADDFGLHMNLLYGLAALFPLSTLLVAPSLERIGHRWMRFTQGIAGLWIASGPIYFLVPDDLKGLFERATMMLLVIWILAVSVLLIIQRRHGRARR